jgi:hypothetical protein
MGTDLRHNVVQYDTGSSAMTLSSNSSSNQYPNTTYTNSFIRFYNSTPNLVLDINGSNNCYIKLSNDASTPKQTIVIDGANADIQVNNSSAVNTIKLDGANANIQVNNNSGVNTIKLDGVNGFIYYPNTSISSGQTLNLGSIPTRTFPGTRLPFTIDLIDGFGQLTPGLYSLVSSNYYPIGSLTFDFNATPSSTVDTYLSLMIVANDNSTYNSTTWQTSEFTNGICLSSSNYKIPKGTSASDYIASFPINGVITITPNYRYLHIILCTQAYSGGWTFNNIPDPTIYVFSPGSTSSTGLALYLKPLS